MIENGQPAYGTPLWRLNAELNDAPEARVMAGDLKDVCALCAKPDDVIKSMTASAAAAPSAGSPVTVATTALRHLVDFVLCPPPKVKEEKPEPKPDPKPEPKPDVKPNPVKPK